MPADAVSVDIGTQVLEAPSPGFDVYTKTIAWATVAPSLPEACDQQHQWVGVGDKGRFHQLMSYDS